MSDKQVVSELRASAQDALSRGFAILTCEPHDKNPWAKYSAHAVNSATTDPSVALKPWADNHEANYGVAAGKSNLTIIDCDSGLQDEAALYAWMAKNGLPETFIVQSGRDTSFGAHLYYSGAVPTTGYQIDGVVGELRGVGAYVVGPGCYHPDSGKQYKIIKDVTIASLPPEGNRWNQLQSKAGKLKDFGLSEGAIYDALKDFCANNCENGASYPDEKIKNLAAWASSDECEASPVVGIVTIGSPDPEAVHTLPETPMDTIPGDYVGDLSLALTKGTFIPPSFARATLKVIAGTMLDGKIAFPGEETLHMRHWNALISARPEAGKSEVWKRCRLFLDELLKKHEVVFPNSGFFSSGEHAIKTLAENDGKSHLVYFDEMKNLFEKGSGAGSTLFYKLLELYEQKSGGVGSLTHNTATFENVSLSMTGNFTRSGFDRSVSGKSAGGDGFLSRMVLEYSGGLDFKGDWDAYDVVKVNAAVVGITESLKWITNFVGETNKGLPYLPDEDAEAKTGRIAFQDWLALEKKRIQEESPDAAYASRIESHFKRDLLIRVAFTPERKITAALVEKSIAWAKHQLMLREEMWPVDKGGVVEKCEQRIMKAIRIHGPLTKSGVQKHSNADKGEGGFEAWNRAWTNVMRADKVIVMQIKSDRGREKFGFDDAIWSKIKGKWIYGSSTA